MNVKNNSRAVLTKKKIESAFLSLLARLGIEHVNVTLLCKEANINRTTFYSYYFDLNDLLETTEQEIMQTLTQNLESISATNPTGASAYVLPYLNFLKDHSEFFAVYFKNSSFFGYKAELRQLFRDAVTPYIKNKFPDEKHLTICLDYLEAGIYAIVKNWGLNGFKESCENIRDLIYFCAGTNLFAE